MSIRKPMMKAYIQNIETVNVANEYDSIQKKTNIFEIFCKILVFSISLLFKFIIFNEINNIKNNNRSIIETSAMKINETFNSIFFLLLFVQSEHRITIVVAKTVNEITNTQTHTQ